MKIIKPGKLPELNTYNGVCYNCNCEIECDESEITLNYIADTNDCPRSIVKCPTFGCNKLITMTQLISK